MARTPSKTRFTRGIYPSYHFKDHDPILDELDALIAVSGVTYKFIETKSGVTTGTLHKWRRRQTKRPQFTTVKAVVKSIGGELTITYAGKEISYKGPTGKGPVRRFK